MKVLRPFRVCPRSPTTEKGAKLLSLPLHPHLTLLPSFHTLIEIGDQIIYHPIQAALKSKSGALPHCAEATGIHHDCPWKTGMKGCLP